MVKTKIYRLCVIYFPAYRSSRKKRNLQPGSSEFSVVNSWLWRVYQQKLYRHKIRDVDNLKRVLLHRRERRARAEKSGDAVYDIYTVDIDRQSKV